MDELLKERYELAKERITEICTETVVQQKYWKEQKKIFLWKNCRKKTEIFMKNCLRKIMHIVMEIRHMQQKSSENTERRFLSFMQRSEVSLYMHMKRNSGIIQ